LNIRPITYFERKAISYENNNKFCQLGKENFSIRNNDYFNYRIKNFNYKIDFHETIKNKNINKRFNNNIFMSYFFRDYIENNKLICSTLKEKTKTNNNFILDSKNDIYSEIKFKGEIILINFKNWNI